MNCDQLIHQEPAILDLHYFQNFDSALVRLNTVLYRTIIVTCLVVQCPKKFHLNRSGSALYYIAFKIKNHFFKLLHDPSEKHVSEHNTLRLLDALEGITTYF